MDSIAIWEPPGYGASVDELADYFYDALWFLKRCGDETLSFRTMSRWWDLPEEIQPDFTVSFRFGNPGALNFFLPGNELRMEYDLPLLTEEMHAKLGELEWISPLSSGLPAWTLAPPTQIDGFVVRYAKRMAETFRYVFADDDTRHLLVNFYRATPPGEPAYHAPLPLLLAEEMELYL